MSYVPLGSRTVQSSADRTGLNAGNLTASFTPAVLNVQQSFFEVYHIVIATQVPGQLFTPSPCHVFIDSKPYTFVYPLGGTEWDPVTAMLIRAQQQIDFCWGLASGSTPVPVVTCWLRYDPMTPGNQG